MREFSFLETFVRRNFFLYKRVRSIAWKISSHVDLEYGFKILDLVKPNQENLVVVDVGCNDGTSISMIRRRVRSLIVAIDPVEEPQGKPKNVKYLKLALGASRSSQEIFSPVYKNNVLTQYSSIDDEGSRRQFSQDSGIHLRSISSKSTRIEIVTLDSLNLNPFFIKIDVEGMEMSVLLGAFDTISRFKPIILVEIQSKNSFDEISNLLSNLNYRCVFLNKLGVFPHGGFAQKESRYTATNNFLWIPETPSNSWSWKF